MKATKILKNIAMFLAIYAFITCFYLSVSPGITEHAIGLHMRRFILATFVCLLPYYLCKKFSFLEYLPEILLSLLWTITFPLTAFLAYGKTASSLSYPYDVVIGAYMFSTLVLSKMLINTYLKNYFRKIFKVIYIILQILLFCIPASNIIYYLLFNSPISSNGMMVIFQTNPTEAWEYITSIPLSILSFSFIALAFFAYSLSYFNFKHLPNINISDFSKRQLYLCIVILPIIFYYTFFSLLPRTSTVRLAIDTNNYFTSIHEYKTTRLDILQQLHVTQNVVYNKPHTIILVIGESATRDYMHAFNKDTDNTTPWLSKKQNEFLLFPHTYACAWNTVPALEHALTEANYYNNKQFNKAISIIDIAKKAGYKTYWFSNQGKIGVHDTPISLIAETADVAHWGAQDTPYDMGLFPYLQTVNKNENNFIVLHLMGSHIDYNNRYPQEYQKWADPNTTGRVADYKNSLLYTDKVLQNFFEYAQQNLNLDAFVYCSDHGTDPNRSRNPDESRFIVLRIPMFVYLSDAYKNANPEIAQNLAAHQKAYFSNDLLYNLVCGLFNVQSNHLEESESLTSAKYKFNIDNVKAGLGTKNIKDDPALKH